MSEAEENKMIEANSPLDWGSTRKAPYEEFINAIKEYHQLQQCAIGVDFATLSQQIADFLREILQVAVECKGVTYGGIVRDYFLPHSLGIDNIDFHDFDVWFTTEEEQKIFHSKVVKKYGCFPSFPEEEVEDYPHMTVKRIYINSPFKLINATNRAENIFLQIDMVTCKIYPCNDISVNLLSYDGKEIKVNSPANLTLEKTLPNKYTLEEIICQIIDKCPDVFTDYLESYQRGSRRMNARLNSQKDRWLIKND